MPFEWWHAILTPPLKSFEIWRSAASTLVDRQHTLYEILQGSLCLNRGRTPNIRLKKGVNPGTWTTQGRGGGILFYILCKGAPRLHFFGFRAVRVFNNNRYHIQFLSVFFSNLGQQECLKKSTKEIILGLLYAIKRSLEAQNIAQSFEDLKCSYVRVSTLRNYTNFTLQSWNWNELKKVPQIEYCGLALKYGTPQSHQIFEGGTTTPPPGKQTELFLLVVRMPCFLNVPLHTYYKHVSLGGIGCKHTTENYHVSSLSSSKPQFNISCHDI